MQPNSVSPESNPEDHKVKESGKTSTSHPADKYDNSVNKAKEVIDFLKIKTSDLLRDRIIVIINYIKRIILGFSSGDNVAKNNTGAINEGTINDPHAFRTDDAVGIKSKAEAANRQWEEFRKKEEERKNEERIRTQILTDSPVGRSIYDFGNTMRIIGIVFISILTFSMVMRLASLKAGRLHFYEIFIYLWEIDLLLTISILAFVFGKKIRNIGYAIAQEKTNNINIKNQ